MPPSLGAQLLLTAVLGCGGSVPVVTVYEHTDKGAEPVRVPHLPPPTKVEVVPLQRDDACRWLGGYWDYRGRGWGWVKGAWVRQEPDCYYAPPVTRFERTPAGMTLVYRRGQWYHFAGGTPCEDAPECQAADGEEGGS